MFRPKKHPIGPVRAEALAAIPVINTGVSVEYLESGELLLTYSATLRPWLSALVKRLGQTPQLSRRKLQLDSLGAWVWKSLDGNRTVGQIITEFAQAHRLHQREAEISVTQFLRDLGQRGLIGMR